MGKTITVSRVERGSTYTAEVRFENGVYVWTANGQVPPNSAIRDYRIDKLPGFNAGLHAQVREAQTTAFLNGYREAMKVRKYSTEEIAEMREAFGDEDVVDVITGGIIKL